MLIGLNTALIRNLEDVFFPEGFFRKEIEDIVNMGPAAAFRDFCCEITAL